MFPNIALCFNCLSPKLNFPSKKDLDRPSNMHIHHSQRLKISQKVLPPFLAWDHVRDHAHFRHDAFFRAFDQVASHTAIKGVVAALETAPEASQAL